MYKKKVSVLIVDDDQQVLKSLRIWLKNEGFKPLTAANLAEAEAVLAENDIDVALVDYRLYKENGIDVAQRLHELDDQIKIIMLTGFPSYETAVEAMKTGIFDYISKGSSNEKILEVLHKAIDVKEREGMHRNQELLGKDVLRLVLFCNHSLLKERLENYSVNSPGFKLVKSFASVDTVQMQRFSQQADIALLCAGCTIPSLDEAYRILPDLYRSFPDIKPVIINENFTDQEKVELLKMGVRGFSSRDLSADQLEKALLLVKSGEVWVSRNVINLSLQGMATYGSQHIIQKQNQYDLSERELEILKTMVMGLKNKEIANKLFISDKTVKTHVNKIFKKLGAQTRAGAILMAVEKHIV